jgi:vancomycin resistance protein YoaR
MANDTIDETTDTDQPVETKRLPLIVRFGGGVLVVLILLVASFELVYVGKVYPGVSADGVYLGGLSKASAGSALADKVTSFNGLTLPINYGSTTVRIPVNSLGVTYDTSTSATSAYSYGRRGSILQQAKEQARALFGRSTTFDKYSYDETALQPYISDIVDDVVTPVANASLDYVDGGVKITDSKTGDRLDMGQLVEMVQDRLRTTDVSALAAPVYQLSAIIGSDELKKTADQAGIYLSAPLQLKYGNSSREVTQSVIATWINVSQPPERDFLTTLKLEDLFPAPASLSLGLDKSLVTKYVADLASKVDQAPQNAGISMTNGQLAVTHPAVEGLQLDQTAASSAIITAIGLSGNRNLTLKATVTQADVREDNLDQLGIKDLLSEGKTFFPGSPSTRLINVQAGANRFNGVLLKPGEVFSFGALLGDVGPQTGYVPELVILGNHEEKQYGGGLCQVSSTAYRAALLAGLPIVERHNHSFAISYYTTPYGVPGVDATIYYPQVDFKFKNDTPGYILIQTVMQGTTLTFDFYGTKTKTGVIRGPQFVTGSNDVTKPSHTVFYRDVLDLTGAVISTDTVDTYYQSSLDFPVQKQFN